MKEFKWFIVILIGMFMIWVTTGGPNNESSKNPFIHQPAPIGQGGTYSKGIFPNTKFLNFFSGSETNNDTNIDDDIDDKVQETLDDLEDSNSSTYKDIVTLKKASAKQKNVDYEYVTIDISPKASGSINITDWKLRSSISGQVVSLGGASYLPRMGGKNDEFPIAAQPGDRIYITTGRSPIGVSFRLNTCTGYLEQFQDFSPSLPRKCPRATDEIPNEYQFGVTPNSFNDQCMDYIEDIGLCKINTQSIPLNMQPQCQEFITKELNYNSCVSNHNNEEGFYKNEWRIFLERDQEIWRATREVIELLDGDNKLIDVITY